MNAKTANNTRYRGVRELQRTLYRAAKRSSTRRFHAMYDKLSRFDILNQAWLDVKRNRGAAGIDGQSLADVREYGVDRLLRELQEELMDEAYRPVPVRRVYIPKGDGRQRPLGIPAVKDRIVQTAAKLVLEPIFEADFQEFSYGFRPQRSAHEAIEDIRQTVNAGYDCVVDADVKGYFDHIDHDNLMVLVKERITDRRMLKLIRSWLRAGVMDQGQYYATETGTPQGGVISPLLANVYLNLLDRLWEKCWEGKARLVRYADDFVALCRSRKQVQQAYTWIAHLLERMGLELNQEKTHLVDLRQGKEGFNFLGFHCRKQESWRWPGYWYLHRWPGKKAMKRIRSKIRALTGRRTRQLAIGWLLKKLNPILRGWGQYYKVGNSSRAFNQIDDYVRLRLTIWLSSKHGQPAWARQRWVDFIQQLPLYQLRGTIAWTKA